MPAPLVWLGAGALAVLATTKHSNDKKLNACVHIMPGMGRKKVAPVDGAVVCCGVFGWFIHTGIWLDGNIIELKGNGLIRGISPRRFIQERSGDTIYIACNLNDQPLVQKQADTRAAAQIFSYSKYDLINNNCHKFVWQCLSGEVTKVSRFSELNHRMSKYFTSSVTWQPLLYKK